jgi:hypothetical protein
MTYIYLYLYNHRREVQAIPETIIIGNFGIMGLEVKTLLLFLITYGYVVSSINVYT